MTAAVIHEINDGVATITLNRPHALNALNDELVRGLMDALDKIAHSSARVVVLTGAGKAFCVGGDLTDGGASSGFSEGGSLPLETSTRVLRLSMSVSQLLHDMPQVTVCAINGGCAGAGLSLACACDLRFAVASARFSTAFISVGLSGDFGYSYFLPRIVGPAKARELCLLADKFDADRALALGLVSGVEPDVAALDAHVASAARRLASFAPLALYAMKRNLIENGGLSLSQTLDNEAARHAQCGAHPDAAEAGRAWLEKRAPSFQPARPLAAWERSRL